MRESFAWGQVSSGREPASLFSHSIFMVLNDATADLEISKGKTASSINIQSVLDAPVFFCLHIQLQHVMKDENFVGLMNVFTCGVLTTCVANVRR